MWRELRGLLTSGGEVPEDGPEAAAEASGRETALGPDAKGTDVEGADAAV